MENNPTRSNGKGSTQLKTLEDIKDLTKPRNRPFTIVALGGSAGSLDAIEIFLESVPPDSGMAFVVVQHQDPAQPSVLPDLLRQCTQMPVHRIEDGMVAQPNQVYVIPENKELTMQNGKFLLLPPAKPQPFRMPIDTFLQSLAEDWGEKAVCIIFSGMGADGELGARFIKEGFGLVMVQDPATAAYDGMPRSTLQTGMVDYVEAPATMADKILRYIHTPSFRIETGEKEIIKDRKVENAMQKIFFALRTRTGHDFSLYKKNTLLRRFERRMNLHQIGDIDEYVRYLQENDTEVDILFKELLIGVTKFFRDDPPFELLGQQLIPEMLKKKGRNDAFRVWIAGCSTGEEAYSIAILIREAIYTLKLKYNLKIQIYATDLDPDAIRRARTGMYPGNISNDISPARLERWFIKKDDFYQIAQEIREMVVFAEHNLIKDASFIKLDLLTCRNVLIYLTPEIQKKLLPVFHYTLLPQGILFLGPSESVGGHEDLFTPVDAKWKIFRKQENVAASTRIIEFPAQATAIPKSSYSPVPGKAATTPAALTLADRVRKTLLEKYTPAAVVINGRGEIMYISGRTGKYLEPPAGAPTLNVFEMAREGLTYELKNAVLKAVTMQGRVVVNRIKIKTENRYHYIRLSVEPLNMTDIGGLMLILFEDLPDVKISRRSPGAAPADTAPSAKEQIIAELENELRYTREHLQQTIEEIETSYEELKSANEELQSTNEELQSTNEESNTAKEEMQALNEELMTINMEFRAKTEELTEVNNDMMNLLNSLEVATIFIGNNLSIKRFTRGATRIVNLIQSDIGRPIHHISSNLRYDRLAEDAQEVIAGLSPKEMRVESHSGLWYHIKISPYRTVENYIGGAVITFTDVSALQKAEEELEANRLFMQLLLNNMHEAILVLDKSLRITSANQAFLQMFRVGGEQVLGRYIYELGTGQWRISPLRKLLEEVLPNRTDFDNYLIEHDFQEVGRKKLSFRGSRFVQPRTNHEMILLMIEEVK
jgi:two-component system, chemotaxis family, CheB/CheR fusion protein